MRPVHVFVLLVFTAMAVAQTAPLSVANPPSTPPGSAAADTNGDRERAAQEYRALLEKEIEVARNRARLEISAANSKSRFDAEDVKLGGELEVLELQCEATAFA